MRTLAAYDALVADGTLRGDPDQRAAAQRLDVLEDQLERRPPRAGLFRRLFKRRPDPADSPRGLYLWGGVGRGKSMLMDLFHDAVGGVPKRRVHFHAFMLDVHQRLRAARASERGDPVMAVAADLGDEVRLLAFDELVVNNSADAMIMGRLFTALIEGGVTVVATSNRPPRDLYKDGLNREHFLPFIALIEARLDVVGLNGPVDYRRDRLAAMARWHVPPGPRAHAALNEAFAALADCRLQRCGEAVDLPLPGGRVLPLAASVNGVARSDFSTLCGEARGAADYLELARTHRALVLGDVPRLGPERRNEAARFVTLIDALYEGRVKLVASADAAPADLYPVGDGRFEFERTISRLEEMLSDDWFAVQASARSAHTGV